MKPRFGTDLPDIQSDQRRIEHIAALTGVLRDLLGSNLMPDATEFAAIYGRVKSKLLIEIAKSISQLKINFSFR